jgi:hypothetical protein
LPNAIRHGDLCFSVVVSAPGQAATAGLTLPAGFALDRAGAGPAALCPSRGNALVPASSVTGTITAADGAAGVAGRPSRFNVDVTLTFAANDAGAPASERLSAQAVDVVGGCPGPVCTLGADQTCNDNPAISSLRGRCTSAGTCVCNAGGALNPATGRCL